MAPCFLNTTVSDLWLSGKKCVREQIEVSSKCSPNDRDWSLRMCGFPLSPSSSKSKQSLKSYTSSAATKPPLCCLLLPFWLWKKKKPFSTVCCPVHHESAVAASGKSKVPPYVPADLLGTCNTLPCCPLPGWKIGGRKCPGKDEAVIENCWCWRQSRVGSGQEKCVVDTQVMISYSWMWIICLMGAVPWILCHINGLLRF